MEDKKAKILVVDDEPEIVDTLKHLLSIKGYEVMGAFSGEEALKVLEKESLDLILLDIMLPGIKGTEVAKIVKQKYPSVKLIIVTGFQNEAETLSRDNLLEGVFLKPIRIQELYNKLLEVFFKKSQPIDLKSKQGIKARVLLIKAKLLFLEPDLEVYDFLSTYLKALSYKGEDYKVDLASNEEEIMEKIILFEPDILVVNASLFKKSNPDRLSSILEENLFSQEIIVYNIQDLKGLKNTELEKLTQAIQLASFKNGLLEVKWVEI